MIFLLDYDRKQTKLVTFKKYDDSQRHQAWDDRLALELDLNRHGIDREVVILEAPSEEAIRYSHARYFDDFPTLAKRMDDAIRAHADTLRAKLAPACTTHS